MSQKTKTQINLNENKKEKSNVTHKTLLFKEQKLSLFVIR